MRQEGWYKVIISGGFSYSEWELEEESLVYEARWLMLQGVSI